MAIDRKKLELQEQHRLATLASLQPVIEGVVFASSIRYGQDAGVRSGVELEDYRKQLRADLVALLDDADSRVKIVKVDGRASGLTGI